MEELARIALVGTTRHTAAATPDVDHPAEGLVARLPAGERENLFLLRAGARAAYEQCGRVGQTGIEAIDPAPSETRRIVPRPLAGLIQNAIASSSWDLLVEFLGQLRAVDLVLSPELLPIAFQVSDASAREAMLPVVGERGEWLSRFNPQWAWVTEGSNQLSSDDRQALEEQWSEGTIGQRCRVLRTLRKSDGDLARTWLETVLDRESADHRVRLLETLSVRPSKDDETLLESRLDDRSENVRRQAAELLARIPGSALALRMRERGEAMLSFEAGKVTCQPPEEIDKNWERDGVPRKVPTGQGKRAIWTEAVFALVPPGTWSTKLAAAPADLIEGVRDDNFSRPVLVGWARAAAAFADCDPESRAWLRPLWDYWRAFAGTDDKKLRIVTEPLQILLGGMPREMAEEAFGDALVAAAEVESADLLGLLSILPRPWSAAFADAYLAAARDAVRRGTDNRAYQWASSLSIAARAIPKARFPQALEPWVLPPAGEGGPGAGRWRDQAIARELEKFTETVSVRQSFFEGLDGEPA